MHRTTRGLLAFGLLVTTLVTTTLSSTVLVAADNSQATSPMTADKLALQPLQTFVGEWRGVAQPKRGSSQGAWTEQSEWSWKFADGHAELVARLSPAKYFARLEVQPGKEAGRFVLLARSKDDEATPAVRYAGALTDDTLTVSAENPTDDLPARITIRLVAAGDRMLVLYEKPAGGDNYARLAEVGSTRKGSAFATRATSGPECVVTGGLGTIAVEHDGEKYFVCCTGCRDLFLLDPTGVLAEYRERKAAEKK